MRLKSPANFRPSASHTAFCARAVGGRARGKGHHRVGALRDDRDAPQAVLPGLAPPHAPDAPALDVEQRIAHRAVAETVRFVAELHVEIEAIRAIMRRRRLREARRERHSRHRRLDRLGKRPPADAHRVRLGAGPYRKPERHLARPVRRDRHLPGGVRALGRLPRSRHAPTRHLEQRALHRRLREPLRHAAKTQRHGERRRPVMARRNVLEPHLRPGAAPRIARCQRAVVREQRIDPAPGASDGPAIEGEAVRRHRHVAVRAVS